jgi:hypothetical protein
MRYYGVVSDFCVGQVEFAHTLASVGEGNTDYSTLAVLNRLAAHIADHHSLTRHD